MNHEVMPNIENTGEFPSLESLLKKTGENIRGATEINAEGVPQCVAFTERNPLACEMFLSKHLLRLDIKNS